jgi:hypothetical protein
MSFSCSFFGAGEKEKSFPTREAPKSSILMSLLPRALTNYAKAKPFNGNSKVNLLKRIFIVNVIAKGASQLTECCHPFW